MKSSVTIAIACSISALIIGIGSWAAFTSISNNNEAVAAQIAVIESQRINTQNKLQQSQLNDSSSSDQNSAESISSSKENSSSTESEDKTASDSFEDSKDETKDSNILKAENSQEETSSADSKKPCPACSKWGAVNPERITEDDGVCVYQIEPGDTLTHLSSIFLYSVDELAQYNDISNPNLIYSNSALRIPSDTK